MNPNANEAAGAARNARHSIDDAALDHLRAVVDMPDVSGTRYELIEVIGRGGMGTVWRARDLLLDREVALKVLADPDEPLAREIGLRLAQEAKVLARLEHPGIVPVHDVGVLADGRAFTCMKLVRGRRLDALLAERPPESESLSLFARVAQSVAFAHSCGVLHLDIHPGNVMVGEFGEVLVLDWGLAAPTGDDATLAAGTPGFMAPEQRASGVSVDARADVHGLGAILGALLAATEVPRPLAAIVARATEALPDERYAGVAALAADVRAWLDQTPVSAYHESLVELVVRLYHRHQALVLLLVTYLVMRLAIFAWRAI